MAAALNFGCFVTFTTWLQDTKISINLFCIHGFMKVGEEWIPPLYWNLNFPNEDEIPNSDSFIDSIITLVTWPFRVTRSNNQA